MKRRIVTEIAADMTRPAVPHDGMEWSNGEPADQRQRVELEAAGKAADARAAEIAELRGGSAIVITCDPRFGMVVAHCIRRDDAGTEVYGLIRSAVDQWTAQPGGFFPLPVCENHYKAIPGHRRRGATKDHGCIVCALALCACEKPDRQTCPCHNHVCAVCKRVVEIGRDT